MKNFRYIYLVFTGFFMTFFLIVKPAQAFTTLQGCYQNPACVKELAAAGMIGTPAAAGAGAGASASAPAAASIAFPIAAGGVALYQWGQDKADALAQPYLPPFGGGQCETQYQAVQGQWSYLDQQGNSRTRPAAGSPSFGAGPLSYLTDKGGQRMRLTTAGGSVMRTIDVSGFGPDAKILDNGWQISRSDGLPDDCGSPLPERDFDESPSQDELDSLLGPPAILDFPSKLPGPDGQDDTDDDIFPPLFVPGPTVAPNTQGDPEYKPDGFYLPNPLGAGSPSAAPNPQLEETNDLLEDIRDALENQSPSDVPLSPPPSQGSDCDGWGYAICELGGKFPFDIVGDLPEIPDSTCPSFSFFGQTAEFCFLRDLLASLKWVAAGSLIVYGVFNL